MHLSTCITFTHNLHSCIFPPALHSHTICRHASFHLHYIHTQSALMHLSTCITFTHNLQTCIFPPVLHSHTICTHASFHLYYIHTQSALMHLSTCITFTHNLQTCIFPPALHKLQANAHSHTICTHASFHLYYMQANAYSHTLEWTQSNRLQLNATKTEQLWYASPRQQEYLPNIRLPLLIGSYAAQPVRWARNLGIYIDSDLSMKSHVSKAVSNSFAALRRLWSIRRLVSQPVLLSLVTSLIMTWLYYGSVTTHTGLPSHPLDRLQSVLNAVARLVCYAH